MPDDPRFFIVGSGRSGSTLLRLLLMGHSRIHIPPETWFIIPLVQNLPLCETLSLAQVTQAAEIMTSSYRWPDMNIPAANLKSSAQALDAPHLRDVIDLVYADQLRASGKPRLGDKTPPYITIVPQLATLYPNAKFIHIIRDGRDVAISYIEMTYECRYYDDRRFDWIAAMRARRSWRGSQFESRILEVRYEDLISRPEPTLRTICSFLGESFEPRMLERTPQIDAVPERERHIHTKLDRPLSRAGIGIWRRKLSGLECFCMEACLHRYLAETGYELRFDRPLWLPLLSITGFVLRACAPLLDRVVPFLKRRRYLPKTLYF